MTGSAKAATGRHTRSDEAGAVREVVATRVGRLQAEYLRQVPSAAAALARLRRAVTADPGSDPALWHLTLDGLDEHLVGRGDDPSAAERAVHVALCLYAVHQQSQRVAMHEPGISLGAAIRRLAGRVGGSEAAVERRFQALGTSQSVAEVAHHARGLVTQLRAAGIGLDYGLLAADMHGLQFPDHAGRVRRAWGRAYHRTESSHAPDTIADQQSGADQ